MSNGIYLTTMKIAADNSTLEQDSNGYYRVILGAFNSFNSAGEFYVDTGIKELLTNESSVFYRRLKNGYLKSEVGHPVMTPGMTKAMFYNRNMKIELTNTCAHIRDVILTPTEDKSEIAGYGNYLLVEGYVKPSGPYGDSLKKALDNPDENVAFSIRCFTKNEVVNGVTIKKVLQIITWDWVTEPGIAKANKFEKLAMSTEDIMYIDLEDISTAEGTIKDCFNCSLEDGDVKEMTSEIINKTKPSTSFLDII